MRIFISYPDKNRDIANEVANLCKSLGHDPFVAYLDMAPPNGRWLRELCKQIDLSDAFILCLDASSLDARYQRYEWEHAIQRNRIIVIMYTGQWDKRYSRPEAFPLIDSYQHYCLENEKHRQLAMQSLGPPHDERFQFMQNLTIEAGTQLMLKHGLRFLIGKPDPMDERKNYATEIDVAVQTLITDRIREEYPQDSILAEESDTKHSSKKRETEFIWTVDPLDGTLNYISGDDRFCCGIGLIRDNRPYMGAIFVPSRMELYTGGEGRPAGRRFIREGNNERMQSEQSITNLSACHALTHVNSEPENIELCFQGDFPRRLHHAVRRVWMWGCGLIALVAISRGSYHLFVQRKTYPWDLVPGLAILRAAGGCDSIWPYHSHQPWTLDKWKANPGIVAACNEKILTAFQNEFKDMRD